MTKVNRAFLILVALGLSSNCAKTKSSDLSFTITPTTLTLLNVDTQNCTDKSNLTSTAISAQASAAIFQKLSISWKNTEKTFVLAAIRFTATDPNFSERIDKYIAGGDLISLSGQDSSLIKTCAFCTISPYSTTTSNTLTFDNGITKTYKSPTGTASSVGCGPILGGFAPKKDVTSNFSTTVKVTVMGYSIDGAGGVTNEYAQLPVTVRYEAAPP